MSKRKRSGDEELEQKLQEYQQELSRALKAAKGFERQRLSKRIHTDKQDQDKVRRFEREVAVLKSLDLHETSRAHLSSSLVKFKAIAEHPALPDGVKHGAPNTKLPEEERISLHNVTSGLYNRQNVRDVVDKAVRGVCMALEIPIPEKKSKGNKKQARNKEQALEDDEKPGSLSDRQHDPENGSETLSGASKRRRLTVDEDDNKGRTEGSSDEFEGFSDDGLDGENTEGEESGADGELAPADAEEAAMAKYEALLGNSDDDSEDAEELRAKYGALLDAHGDDEESEGEDEDDEEFGLGEEDFAGMEDEDGFGSSGSEDVNLERQTKDASKGSPKPRSPTASERSPSPPMTRKTKESKATTTGSTTFLPTLMGGYFSGSESASDVDVAPRKKRLGQRQRQAIAERKHGEKANHVQKQAQQQEKNKKGRDSGWDMKRGAVDASDAAKGKGRQPWKKNSVVGGSRGDNGSSRGRDRQDAPRSEKTTKFNRPNRPADQGPLHPSWQARQKQKEAEKTAAFQGTKITF